MGRSNEAHVKWLKELGSMRGGEMKLAALLAEPPSEDAGADSGPDLIDEQGVARADSKRPGGPEVPPRSTDKEQQSKRDNWKPTNFPPGVPDKDEQDKRDNRNDSGAFKGKTVTVKDPRKPKNQPPKGKAQPLRIVLVSSGIKVDGPEPRTPVVIQGEIPIGSNSKADADAILKAIEKEEFKVSIGGVPAKVELRSAEGYKPDKSRFAIKIWIRTSIPTIERPGKDEIVDAPVVVQIGDISSDGKATIKVHYKPPPPKDPKTPAPTGFEPLDVLKRPLFPKGTAK